ncbi:MAG: hypothetical protein ACRD3J_10595, partial [Thermoanaerobaculia bacterium]
MSLRIGIFVMTFPQQSETFIVTKVLKLIDAGFDVHIFTFAESSAWSAFRILDGRDDVLARVHVVPALSLSKAALTRSLRHLFATARAHPRSLMRYIAHNWKTRHETDQGFWKQLALRLHFVGYELDVLHIE